ncbi:hypothetical protein [Phormidium sp. FACHB-1136]|uniref:hypothetical protein n=1 Tax=Phormidium sp. FACHB-1136 TaxID=2692848 RepID=UPI001683035D|nr:hypothetical protein [Phormidium sp. FACHB-1136]MBD2427528.1 hypothetical protein [Phormidium sp. FACHB-1136]
MRHIGEGIAAGKINREVTGDRENLRELVYADARRIFSLGHTANGCTLFSTPQ